MSVICPYCQKKAELTDSAEVYGGRSYGLIWLCRPCWAYVGVHKGTTTPLGRLANAELREWKKRAHAHFDPLWKRKIEREGCLKSKARGSGYKWLANELGIAVKDCHIGMFDIDTCKRVIEVCSPFLQKDKSYDTQKETV